MMVMAIASGFVTVIFYSLSGETSSIFLAMLVAIELMEKDLIMSSAVVQTNIRPLMILALYMATSGNIVLFLSQWLFKVASYL